MTDILGILIFDSAIDSLPELRGGPPTERHVIYEGGGILLDLLLRTIDGDDALYIAGQVLPADEFPGGVANLTVLLENCETRMQSRTNALGEFRFNHIPQSGSFDISIELGARRFLVRGLTSADPRTWNVIAAGSKKRTAGGSPR